jgi:hypothetical protein
MDFDLAQTFYIDPDQVQNASYVYLTSLDLFFQAKPVEGKTQSGLPKPGVAIYVAPTIEKFPDMELIHHTRAAYLPYDAITASTDGTVATNFKFIRPVLCNTDAIWSILIKFDGSDNGYKLWYNKAGEVKLGTKELTSVSQGKVDGYFFKITNGKDLTPRTDADLSFRLKLAEFTSLSTTWKYRNRPYEVLDSYNINGVFKGGEDVYQKRSVYSVGTVDVRAGNDWIVGTGTSLSTDLSIGSKFVITDGTLGNTVVRTVATVPNATHLSLDAPPSFTNTGAFYYKTVVGKLFESNNNDDTLIIEDSNANSTVYLTTNTTIYGVDTQASANISSIEAFQINSLVPHFQVFTPKEASITATVNLANSSYAVDGTNAFDAELLQRYEMDRYAGVMASATIEKTTAIPFASISGSVTFSTTNKYVSPFSWEENLDMFSDRFSINNSITNEHIAGQGQATARYISKSLALASGQVAEDMKVYVRLFKPYNTDIAVFARFRTPGDVGKFSGWTLMSPTDPNVTYSNQQNKQDFIELAYEMPFFPAGTVQSGFFASQSANAILTGTSAAVNTSIAVGDLVRVYSAAISNTYLVDSVVAANTTTLTLSQPISNSSLIGSGLLVDKITQPLAAFLDVQNKNILTYFNNPTLRGVTGNQGKSIGFDSYQFKVILLSSDGILVPFVKDFRAIAVSA